MKSGLIRSVEDGLLIATLQAKLTQYEAAIDAVCRERLIIHDPAVDTYDDGDGGFWRLMDALAALRENNNGA